MDNKVFRFIYITTFYVAIGYASYRVVKDLRDRKNKKK
jgi:hypothetical protein